MQGGSQPRITGPSSAAPGDRITVKVEGGKEVAVMFQGHPKPIKLPVRDGKVDIKIPADVRPGTLVTVIISDVIPPPGIAVEIASND